ncbi:hypothetical protein DL769_001522 [Monosporascus sp. CRB-8-3]|nr:hypothetical protein DL769_001522 [Monosporascus sp. CRB-8-3]
MLVQTLLGIHNTHGNSHPQAFTTRNQLPQPLIYPGQKYGAIAMMHTEWHSRTESLQGRRNRLRERFMSKMAPSKSRGKDIERERRVQECMELLSDIFPSKKAPDADEDFMYRYRDFFEEDSIQAAKGIYRPKDLDDTVSDADMSDLTYERGRGRPSSQESEDAHKPEPARLVRYFGRRSVP